LAFGANFISSWIRIRIWNADPDPRDKFNPDTDPDPKHWSAEPYYFLHVAVNKGRLGDADSRQQIFLPLPERTKMIT
jgi:hypothetical protein